MRTASGIGGLRYRLLGAIGGLAALAVLALPSAAVAQADGCPNAGLRVGPSAGLPDCRAFELVSPPDKLGGQGAGLWYAGPVTAGRAGVGALAASRFAVEGQWGVVLEDGAFSFASDWSLAERGEAGWTRKPAVTRTAYGTQDYRFLNMAAAAEDLSLTGWQSNGSVLKLFPEMAGWSNNAAVTPTLVRDWGQGRWDVFGPTLLTSGQTPGSPSGGTETWPLSATAVSDDGRFMIGSGPTRGLEGPDDPTLAPGALATATGSVYLFDLAGGVSDTFPTLADGRRILVNECTAGTAVPALTADSPAKLSTQPCAAGGLTSSRGATLGATTGSDTRRNFDRMVSTDGSRVVFMSPNPFTSAGAPSACSGSGASTACPVQVFVRQRGLNGTVAVRWISRPAVAGQDASLLSKAFYEGASRDGGQVVFRTTSPLTGDDPNAGCAARQAAPLPCTTDPNGAQNSSSDLFMYELPGGPDGDPGTADGDPAGGSLTRISAGPNGDGDCNVMVNGNNPNANIAPAAVRYMSDDGSRVYFTCQEPLAGVSGAPADSHAGNAPGSGSDFTNLYLYQRGADGEQSWRFVARLPRNVGGSTGSRPEACASTGSGKGTPLNAAVGRGPGVNTHPNNCFRGRRDGAFVTFWTPGQLTGDDPDATSVDIYAYDADSDRLTRITAPDADAVGGTYVCNPGDSSGPDAPCYGDGGFGGEQAQALLRSGIVEDPADPGSRVAVFQSKSQLVAEDTDEVYDVYVWRDGVLSLLTPGDSPTDGAMFLGNDRAGANIYVATLDRLTWEDRDSALDVYAARVGGGFTEPPDPPACSVLADVCQPAGPPQSAVPPPVTPTPGGGGDARPCARVRLALGGLSRRARLRAARSGVLRLRVRTSEPGVVRVGARARLGRRARRPVKVAGARRRVARAGSVRVGLRLSRRARRVLGSGRALRLVVRVAQSGARTRTVTVGLKRGSR